MTNHRNIEGTKKMTSDSNLNPSHARPSSSGPIANPDDYRPHGYLIGTFSRPSQITIYGLTGGPERWLRIPIDGSRSPETFVEQALEVAKANPIVRFFGPLTGFAINYSPNCSVRYDTDGRPLETLGEPYAPGRAFVLIDDKPIRFAFLPTEESDEEKTAESDKPNIGANSNDNLKD